VRIAAIAPGGRKTGSKLAVTQWIALEQRGDGGTELRALPLVAAGTRLIAENEPN
jgi:hypothetical protein